VGQTRRSHSLYCITKGTFDYSITQELSIQTQFLRNGSIRFRIRRRYERVHNGGKLFVDLLLECRHTHCRPGRVVTNRITGQKTESEIPKAKKSKSKIPKAKTPEVKTPKTKILKSKTPKTKIPKAIKLMSKPIKC